MLATPFFRQKPLFDWSMPERFHHEPSDPSSHSPSMIVSMGAKFEFQIAFANDLHRLCNIGVHAFVLV
jgi:hypothetical protein